MRANEYKQEIISQCNKAEKVFQRIYSDDFAIFFHHHYDNEVRASIMRNNVTYASYNGKSMKYFIDEVNSVDTLVKIFNKYIGDCKAERV